MGLSRQAGADRLECETQESVCKSRGTRWRLAGTLLAGNSPNRGNFRPQLWHRARTIDHGSGNPSRAFALLLFLRLSEPQVGQNMISGRLVVGFGRHPSPGRDCRWRKSGAAARPRKAARYPLCYRTAAQTSAPAGAKFSHVSTLPLGRRPMRRACELSKSRMAARAAPRPYNCIHYPDTTSVRQVQDKFLCQPARLAALESRGLLGRPHRGAKTPQHGGPRPGGGCTAVEIGPAVVLQCGPRRPRSRQSGGRGRGELEIREVADQLAKARFDTKREVLGLWS